MRKALSPEPFAQKIGRFEMADTGTLFLDEIGDIPLALQPQAAALLQEKEFERLGSGKTPHIDVRLVVATHRNLEEMVALKQFRSDLYYRLNVFPIVLPACANAERIFRSWFRTLWKSFLGA